MSLFALYSRDSIPANRNHILTFDKVKHWPHLQILKDKLSPPLNCPIGLIIGYDNASVFAPLRCVPSVNFGPYSQLTWLGWSVVGCVNPSYKSGTTRRSVCWPMKYLTKLASFLIINHLFVS